MTTIVKFLITLLLGVLLTSCKTEFNSSQGLKGNGKVITKNREVFKSFTKIKASEGLEIFLTQDSKNSIDVQADENIHQYIITEVIDGTLELHTSEQLDKANAKKVFVNFKTINEIISSSGANVKTSNIIETKELIIKASSGSMQQISIVSGNIGCTSSSGANIRLKGETEKINATASSGSFIDALKLISEKCKTKTSSGANINVFCSSEINSSASSGSNTMYGGNPKKVNQSKSSGAKISSY